MFLKIDQAQMNKLIQKKSVSYRRLRKMFDNNLL